MPFTEVEYAILSQCAYYDVPDGAEEKTLYDFLDNNRNKLRENLGEGYHSAIDSLISKVKDEHYNIVMSTNDKDDTGFAALAIRDPENNITVACRGTEGFSMDYDSRKDVYADIQLAVTLQSNQQKKLEMFMEQLQNGNYNKYYFTGHSLGGNLAMYGALCLEDPDQLGRVVTFNAPGFNSAFMTLNAEKIAEIERKITSYQNECDGVSESFTVPGNVVVVECKGWDIFKLDGVQGHMLDAFVVDGNGTTFKNNRTGKKDATLLGVVLDTVTRVSDIGMLTLVPGAIIYDFYQWSKRKLSKWALSVSKGYKYSSSNPQIEVNTTKLVRYADRLQGVNKRLDRVDQRLDKLYWKVGLKDLWNLIQADVLTDDSYRLKKCADYLNDTALDFDKVESDLLRKL